MTDEEYREFRKNIDPSFFKTYPYQREDVSVDDEDPVDTAEGDAPFYRELQHGFDRSTWLGGNIYRYLAAAGDQELLEEREKERLSELDEEYKDLTTEEKQSGWSIAGEMGSMILDPTALPLYAAGGAGVAAKGAQLAMGTRRLLNAATQGSISAGDYAVYELSKGNEVDPTWLAGSAGLGGFAGALLLPKNLKVTRGDTSERVVETIDGKSKVSLGKREDVLPDLEDGVQKFLNDTMDNFYKKAPDTIGDIVYASNNGWKILASKNILALHREQKSLRKEFINRPLTEAEHIKFKNLEEASTHLNDADFIKLGKAREEAALFLRRDLPKIIADQAEEKSELVMGTAGALHVNGMLNTNTIAHAVYRPIIGAMGGFGLSATTSMFSDSEFNPIPWMLGGAILGVFSKKIVNSQYTSEIKKAGTDAAQTIIRNSIWAQANVLFSGGAAAKAQAFGGKVHDLSKALFEQVGFGLKGAANPSVEEASELMRQRLNHDWTQALDAARVVGGGRFEEMRRAATKLAEGFTDLPTLSKTFSDDELAKISKLSKEAQDIVERVADEVSSVGMAWKPNINSETGKVDYNLPQSHDTLKMATTSNAREIYNKAWRLEKQAEAKGAGKDPSKIKIDDSVINDWFDTMVTYGTSNNARRSAFSEGTQGRKRIRPLASHFEQERFFKSFEARKLLAENDFLKTDIDHVMKEYIGQTVPILEFARRFGSKGEGIVAFKNGIRNDFKKVIEEATTEKKRLGLVSIRERNLAVVDEMVEIYFGKVHKSGNAANHQMSNAVMSIAVTGANLAYLPKVMISSLGELAQPFINSGAWNSMKGFARALDKQTDIGQATGFSGRDVANNELLQYQLQANLPNSKIQRGTLATNQVFFKYNGLIPFTMFTRRYAYNTGIERAFEIAQKITKKRTTSLQNSANAANLSDDKIKILNKFDDLGEALKDSEALEILNIAGARAANRDAILPMLSNRRGWSQSNNPYMKSLFQFLSWAQAKTTQTNAIVSRMEDGDHALFARTLGSLALFDGIVTFKSFLNDPTGEWLDERDEDTYQEVYSTLENIGTAVQHSGNFNHVFIDKIARLASSPGGRHPIEAMWPVVAWSTEMFDSYSPLIGSSQEGDVWRNLREGDIEGATKRALKPLPLGDEVLDFLSFIGRPIENRPPKKRRGPIEIGGRYYSKGGVVEDVPRVPKEPDERIDKMTGRPYNEQAGGAFIDEEDPLKRLGFVGGGSLDDPLRRLGFVGGSSKAVENREEYAIGSLVPLGVAEFMSRGARSQRHMSPDEILNENTDEVIAMNRKQIDLVSDEVIEEVPEILYDAPLEKQADEAIEIEEGYSPIDEQLKRLRLPTAEAPTKGLESGSGPTQIPSGRAAAWGSDANDQGTNRAVTEYTIQQGDTLSEIADNLGLDMAELAEANGIEDANKIYAGKKLTLPSRQKQEEEKVQAVERSMQLQEESDTPQRREPLQGPKQPEADKKEEETSWEKRHGFAPPEVEAASRDKDQGIIGRINEAVRSFLGSKESSPLSPGKAASKLVENPLGPTQPPVSVDEEDDTSYIPENISAFGKFIAGNVLGALTGREDIQGADIDIAKFGGPQQDVLRAAMQNATKAGRNHTIYADYPKMKNGERPANFYKGKREDRSLIDLAIASFRDPVFEMFTTLGVFEFEALPDGEFRISDDPYDFAKGKSRPEDKADGKPSLLSKPQEKEKTPLGQWSVLNQLGFNVDPLLLLLDQAKLSVSEKTLGSKHPLTKELAAPITENDLSRDVVGALRKNVIKMLDQGADTMDDRLQGTQRRGDVLDKGVSDFISFFTDPSMSTSLITGETGRGGVEIDENYNIKLNDVYDFPDIGEKHATSRYMQVHNMFEPRGDTGQEGFLSGLFAVSPENTRKMTINLGRLPSNIIKKLKDKANLL